MIYFDYNATTPVDPAAVEAMMPYLVAHHGNPSSSHAPGRKIRAAIDTARLQLADLLGASTDELVFTSGGSEANNHALKGIAFREGKGHIVISAVEHPAVAMPARWLAAQGFEVTCVGVENRHRRARQSGQKDCQVGPKDRGHASLTGAQGA